MIHLVGSNGFFGQQIEKDLQGHKLVKFWSSKGKNKESYFSLFEKESWDLILSEKIDRLVFLSWPHLPNYNKIIHLSETLSFSIQFLEKVLSVQPKKIIILGTCYEYGLREGCLKETEICMPVTQYGLAKNTLHESLKMLLKGINTTQLCWLRIFYPYGTGQNPNSLYPSLIRAINTNEQIFNMSAGTQSRDFISVEDASQQILKVLFSNTSNGVYNICSGQPLSIKDFANRVKKENNSNIFLNYGAFPERDDEPKCFYGDNSRIMSLI